VSKKRYGGYTVEQLKAHASSEPGTFDEDNPPLTAEDWKNMIPIEEAPPELLEKILSAFPKTRVRGPQKSPTKEAVSLRLSSEVLDHYRATGRGWQTRIDETLKAAIKKAG
jgi:uncharacterized protein (DUF4415 family)